nr:unnamed protein product [Digitaria exilis]
MLLRRTRWMSEGGRAVGSGRGDAGDDGGHTPTPPTPFNPPSKQLSFFHRFMASTFSAAGDGLSVHCAHLSTSRTTVMVSQWTK